MSFSEVRSYFKERLREVDPDLTEWKEPLNDENVPENLLESSYHISMSNVTTTGPEDQHLSDSFTVDLKLWKKVTNKDVDDHDVLLDLANCVRLNAVQPIKINQTNNIRSVRPTGIVLEPIVFDNDNIIKAVISFELILFFKIGEFSLS